MNDSWWYHKSIYENMNWISLLCVYCMYAVVAVLKRFNKNFVYRKRRRRRRQRRRWWWREKITRTKRAMLQSTSHPTYYNEKKNTPIFYFVQFLYCVYVCCVYFLLRHLLISFRCNVNKITPNVYSNFILFVCLFIYLFACLFVYYLVIILTSIIVVRYGYFNWLFTTHYRKCFDIYICAMCVCVYLHIHKRYGMVDWVTSCCLTLTNRW